MVFRVVTPRSDVVLVKSFQIISRVIWLKIDRRFGDHLCRCHSFDVGDIVPEMSVSLNRLTRLIARDFINVNPHGSFTSYNDVVVYENFKCLYCLST